MCESLWEKKQMEERGGNGPFDGGQVSRGETKDGWGRFICCNSWRGRKMENSMEGTNDKQEGTTGIGRREELEDGNGG